MIIHEVSELSFDYATLDEKHLRFLQNAFTGASVLTLDEGGQKSIPVADLKVFDQIQAITEIPPGLKIAKVVDGLAPLMEKNGLLEFKVIVPADVKVAEDESRPIEAPMVKVGSSEAAALSRKKAVEVKKFISTIENATEDREEATNFVEEMLDSGRSGKFSSKGVEKMVGEIVANQSTSAMKAIAGLRGSDQTYAHCVDMSVILQDCYADILTKRGKEAGDEINRFTMFSGFMHDIGKSEVPKEVLESTEKFAPDSQEMMILRNHTTYGAKILTGMDVHPTIINVAHYHHVKKDTSLFTSYPDVPYEKVSSITRLASIVDVYQALIGNRKYKKNWVPGKAVEYILKLKGSEFDETLLNYFMESMGRYPVGSLVRLSSKELAFVLMIAPPETPERPIVAIVENGAGELISNHTLLDLMMEPDISIVEVVDHYEHYDESEDQAYRIFQSIRIQ